MKIIKLFLRMTILLPFGICYGPFFMLMDFMIKEDFDITSYPRFLKDFIFHL